MHMSVNNLPKVVTRQSGGGRGSNSRPLSHQSDALATKDIDSPKGHRILNCRSEVYSVAPLAHVQLPNQPNLQCCIHDCMVRSLQYDNFFQSYM